MSEVTFDSRKQADSMNYELSNINVKITDTAVLDGQQRLTSLFLSLFGRAYIRQKHARKKVTGGTVVKLLIELNKHKLTVDEEEYNSKKFDIKFTEKVGKLSPTQFEINNIFEDKFQNDTTRDQAIEDAIANVPADSKEYARNILNKLYNKIFVEKLIRYTEIQDMKQDDALEMFVRFNSGGKALKKHEITMSILEAYWPNAKTEFGNLLDGSYTGFGSDFIVRSAFMLYGDVVKSNINKQIAEDLKNNWQDFRKALKNLEEVLKGMKIEVSRFSSSWNVLLPIIYFMYYNPDYATNLDGIRAYLIRAVLFTYFQSGTTSKFSFEVTRQIDNVKALVETVSLSAGLQYTDVDASDLKELAITGISSAGDQTRRSIIEQLQAVFLFDAIERSGKIVFKRRYANTAYEIPDEYLGAYGTSPPNEPYTLQYKDERELPRRLTINYLSKDKDYQQGTMSAYRQITQSKNEQTVSVQMVMADTDAKQLAEVRLFEEWQNRKTLSLTLSNQFGWLLPGDILKVPIQEQKQNFMITKTTYGKPGLIKIEAVATTQQVYTSVGRVVDSETNPSIPPAPGNVSISLFDLPLLPSETSAERMFAACTSDGAFYGANLFRSNDGGGTWSYVGQVTQNAVVGTTITVLPPGNSVTWDEASTVDVTLSHGTLESRPAGDVLNYFNAALIGAEIVQFKQASLIAANTYRLSGLLRGRLGTEHEVDRHIANEPFLMLNSLQSISFPTSEWHMDKLYRIGPSTLPITDEKYRDYTVNLNGLGARPYSVCHVSGFKDGTGSLTVSWVRRARMNGDWKPYTDVPVGENSETYQVDVVSADGNIKRTITVNEPKAVYSANEQIVDFGSLQAVVRVRIYQMSEVYGRGVVKEEVL